MALWPFKGVYLLAQPRMEINCRAPQFKDWTTICKPYLTVYFGVVTAKYGKNLNIDTVHFRTAKRLLCWHIPGC